MTLYEIMQEQGKKFKFSKSGVLYLNDFEHKEEIPKAKYKNKPFSLWKSEEGKKIDKSAKDEINKARIHGNPNFANYELSEGILKFVPGKVKPKEEEEVNKEEEVVEEEAV